MCKINFREKRLSENYNNADYEKRTPFEKDRDKILYRQAFQRLTNVTQIISPDEGIIFHNRLTHSLKVAQIARRLAEMFLKNNEVEDNHEMPLKEILDPNVVEAAGLAHDIGHPPFGHKGGDKLNEIIKIKWDNYKNDKIEYIEKFNQQKWAKFLNRLNTVINNKFKLNLNIKNEINFGFEGNAQTFRIVTSISKVSSVDPKYGIDLTRATLNAILKYPWLYNPTINEEKFGAYLEDIEAFVFSRIENNKKFNKLYKEHYPQKSFESEIVELADDITYAVHDIADFYKANIIPLDKLLLNDGKIFISSEWKILLKNTYFEWVEKLFDCFNIFSLLEDNFEENFYDDLKKTLFKSISSNIKNEMLKEYCISFNTDLFNDIDNCNNPKEIIMDKVIEKAIKAISYIIVKLKDVNLFYLQKSFSGSIDQNHALDAFISCSINDFFCDDLNKINPEYLNSEKRWRLNVPPLKEFVLKIFKMIAKYYVIDNPFILRQQEGYKVIIEEVFEIYFDSIAIFIGLKDGNNSKTDKNKYLDILPAYFKDFLIEEQKKLNIDNVKEKSSETIISKYGDKMHFCLRLTADIIASFSEKQIIDTHKRLKGISSSSVFNKIIY